MLSGLKKHFVSIIFGNKNSYGVEGGLEKS